MQRIAFFESLENRRLLSAVPTIDTLEATPSPLTRGDKLTINATASDSDGSVKSVSIFLDIDNSGTFDPTVDPRIARDGSAGNGFSPTVSAAATKRAPLGSVTLFAVATDNSRDDSDPAPLFLTVNNAAPTIKKVNLAPKKLTQGKKLNIIATGLKDVDGKPTAASFFEDTNANGTIEEGTDTLLGTDSDPKGGLKITLDAATTAATSTGEHTILAQVTDNDGGTSNVASATLTVVEPKGGGGTTPGTDLTILSATITPSTYSLAGTGNTVVTWKPRARNLGDTASLENGYSLWLSTNNIFGDGDDIFVGAAETPAFAGGATRTDTNTTDLATSGISPAVGSYFVMIKVDAGDTIAETNETNNVFITDTASFTITA